MGLRLKKKEGHAKASPCRVALIVFEYAITVNGYPVWSFRSFIGGIFVTCWLYRNSGALPQLEYWNNGMVGIRSRKNREYNDKWQSPKSKYLPNVKWQIEISEKVAPRCTQLRFPFSELSSIQRISKFWDLSIGISFGIWILAFEIDSSELTTSPAHFAHGQRCSLKIPETPVRQVLTSVKNAIFQLTMIFLMVILRSRFQRNRVGGDLFIRRYEEWKD